MGIVLGIDIGSSATKIVAMDESKTILNSLKVSASDPVTAMYGAVGKILCEERMQIADVEAVMLTGMGASYVEGDVYGLPTTKVTEFDALGTGGLYLTGLKKRLWAASAQVLFLFMQALRGFGISAAVLWAAVHWWGFPQGFSVSVMWK